MTLRATHRSILGATLLLAMACSLRADGEDRWRRRDRWQRVPDLLTAMAVRRGATVADIGAGRGYLTVHLAEAVGAGGLVYAVDIDEAELAALTETVRSRKLTNVVPVLGEADDPRLPAEGLDAVIVMRAYHEMRQHRAMLERIRSALAPGGRLVIVDEISDHRRRQSRAQQTAAHEIAIGLVREDLARAGFEILEARERFIDAPATGGDEMWLLVARRPDRGSAVPGVR